MGLSGRPLDRDIGLLSTSKLYQLGDKFIVFMPQFMDRHRLVLFMVVGVQCSAQIVHILGHARADGRVAQRAHVHTLGVE